MPAAACQNGAVLPGGVRVSVPLAAPDDVIAPSWWGHEGAIRTFYVAFSLK